MNEAPAAAAELRASGEVDAGVGGVGDRRLVEHAGAQREPVRDDSDVAAQLTATVSRHAFSMSMRLSSTACAGKFASSPLVSTVNRCTRDQVS